MIIRCKKTKRFLCDIDIENYLSNLEKLGIKQEIPLRITCVCKNCKKVEIYDIYKNHYIFVKNDTKTLDKHTNV